MYVSGMDRCKEGRKAERKEGRKERRKDLGPLIGKEEHSKHLKVIRNYCLVYVAQEKYGGSVAQPQKGLSAHTISTVLKTLPPEEERSK